MYVTFEEYEQWLGSRAEAYENMQKNINYYNMLVIDYITNNTCRYADDWGILIGSNTTHFEIAPLGNFDQAFSNLSGALSSTTYQQLSLEEAAKYAVKNINIKLENVLNMKKPEELTDAQWEQVKARVKVLIDFKKDPKAAKELERLRNRVKPTSLFG